MRAAIALLLALSSPALAGVEVVDGDTIRVDGARVRLWGYDAPERLQRRTINGVDRAIGEEATEGLKAILAGGELRCKLRQDHDQNGRPVMECWAGSVSIGDAMVRLGWAWAVPHFSKGLFGPGTWPKSGRYTSINGQVLPVFKATQGQLERWRMIHGGVRDTISLRIVKMKPAAQLAATFSQAEAQAFIEQSCNDAGISYFRVAADGLTLAQAQGSNLTVFQPGYRWDALTVFPETGRYCLIDSSSPNAGSVNGDSPNPSLLGFVDVEPGTPVQDIGRTVTDALMTAAEASMPAGIKEAVTADLKAGIKFSHFVPHPDIAGSEVTGTQDLSFFIRLPPDSNPDKLPTLFEVSNTLSENDAKPYDPTRLDRALKLGTVDEWTIHSKLASHPFHIHVNPFQVVSILDPNGKDVSGPGGRG